MNSDSLALLRQAMQLREEGSLHAAIDMLRAPDLGDLASRVLFLKLLFEMQDFAALQVETRQTLARLTPQHVASADESDLIWLLYSGERCCLPRAMICAALEKLDGALHGKPDLRKAVRAISHRMKYRTDLGTRYDGGATVISLGLNCLPWHLPGRWGLRRPRDFIDAFVPFALAGHTIEGVLTALESDFSDYDGREVVRLIKTQRGHDFAMRKDRGAFWNHNRSAYWLRDDLEPLRVSNAQKAANFRQLATRANAVFLLATCPLEYPKEELAFLPRLQAALTKFTGRQKNRILITNQTARNETSRILNIDENTSFFYQPYPSKDYVWHDDTIADSKDGLVFERAYTTLLVKVLIGWGLLRRRAGRELRDKSLSDAA